MKDLPQRKLTRFQQMFADRFRSQLRSGSIHLLIGPRGSGKSFGAASIIGDLVVEARLRRILVLISSTDTTKWDFRLRSYGAVSSSVGGRALRVLRERHYGEQQDWPIGTFLLPLTLAKKPDHAELLTGQQWDVVAIDAGQIMPQEVQTILRTLEQATVPPAMLLLAESIDQVPPAVSAKAIITEWTNDLKTISVTSGRANANGPAFVTRKYRRAEEEVELALSVADLASKFEPLVASTLIRPAISSIAFLEQNLTRWLATPDLASEIQEKVEDCLNYLEEIDKDSKLEAWRLLVQDLLNSGSRHIVVFADFRSTIEYLRVASEAFGRQIFALHGALPTDERCLIAQEFKSNGGLLITSTPGCAGMTFDHADSIIQFDLPRSELQFIDRAGTYRSFDRTKRHEVYALEDESGAYAQEEVLLDNYKRNRMKLSDLGWWNLEEDAQHT